MRPRFDRTITAIASTHNAWPSKNCRSLDTSVKDWQEKYEDANSVNAVHLIDSIRIEHRLNREQAR